MNFRIILKKEIYEEIFTLMTNITELNGGNEIAGWFLGDWSFKGENAILFLDEFIIPKQEVSSAEVDITEESLLDTFQEIGVEKSNRIKAHWHIHPFNEGKTDWSGTDEEKIKDFMNPIKNREIFVFLLSSLDQIKGRIELNIKGKIEKYNKNLIVQKSLDNIIVEKEGSTEENPYFEKLKKRIEEKVITTNKNWNNWKDYGKNKSNRFVVNINKDVVCVTMDIKFAEFILDYDCSEELKTPDKMKNKGNGRVTWFFKANNINRIDKLKERIEDELITIEYDEYDTFNDYDYLKGGYDGFN